MCGIGLRHRPAGPVLNGIAVIAIPLISFLVHASELQAQAESVPNGMSMDGAPVEFSLMSLRDLIVLAYRIKPYQLPGTDGWLITGFGGAAVALNLTRTLQGPMPGTLPNAVPPEDDPAGGTVPESMQSLVSRRATPSWRRLSSSISRRLRPRIDRPWMHTVSRG